MDKDVQTKELLDAVKQAATLFVEMNDGDIQIIKLSGRYANYFEQLAKKYDSNFIAGYDIETEDDKSYDNEEYSQDTHSMEIIDQPESGGP